MHSAAAGDGNWPRCRPEGDNVPVSMPNEDNAGSDREAAPLGAEVAPPADPESQGGEPGPASGIAGPSYPPAETEPDAH